MRENLKKFFINKKMYFLSLGMVLLFVFPLFIMEYSTDTYHFALYNIADTIGEAMLKNGRFITGVVSKMLGKIGFDIVGLYYFSFIVAIICSSFSVYELYKLLRGHMWKNLAFFLAFITVFNPLNVEFYLFTEKGFFAFAILMAILALKFFVKFLKGYYSYVILSYLCLLFSALTYQLLVPTFVTLALVFIVIYSKNIKEFLINNVFAITIYGFANCVDYIALITYNAENTRMSGTITISNIFKYFFITERWWVGLIYLALFFVVFGSFCLYSKRKYGSFFEKTIMISFSKYCYIFVGATLAMAVPFIFVNPVETWMCFRTAYPLGVLLGAIPILVFYKKERVTYEKTRPFAEKVRKKSIIMLVILVVEVIFFHAMIFSRIINNIQDEKLCREIGRIIENYESETGNTVKYVNIYHDSKVTQTNKGVFRISDCNVRAFSRSWCDVAHMSCLLDRDFIKGNSNKYSEYFKNKDFKEFNAEEQLIFEGNTLHLCVY